MDNNYKEVPPRGQRPSPWKMKSLPKFTHVPERQFNGCSNVKIQDGQPPTPPPSPIGMFKYPALLRSSKTWPRTTSVDAIVTELCTSPKHDMTKRLVTVQHDQDDKKLPTLITGTCSWANSSDEKVHGELQKVQPRTLRNFLIDIKPASGKTKMCLWPESKSIKCPKLDPSSSRKTASERSLKVSASKVEGVAKVSGISIPKKLKTFMEAGDGKKYTSVSSMAMSDSLNKYFDSTSAKYSSVVLKHPLSLDPVMSKHDFIPRVHRSMIFPEKPIKKEISHRNESPKTVGLNRLKL